jgi:sec-independent protein translocase protein TatA
MTFALLEGPDLIIVLVIVLVLFGGSKLPGLARSLGEAQREFHKGTRSDETTSGSRSGPDTVTMSKTEYDQLRERHPEAGD